MGNRLVGMRGVDAEIAVLLCQRGVDGLVEAGRRVEHAVHLGHLLRHLGGREVALGGSRGGRVEVAADDDALDGFAGRRGRAQRGTQHHHGRGHRLIAQIRDGLRRNAEPGRNGRVGRQAVAGEVDRTRAELIIGAEAQPRQPAVVGRHDRLERDHQLELGLCRVLECRRGVLRPHRLADPRHGEAPTGPAEQRFRQIEILRRTIGRLARGQRGRALVRIEMTHEGAVLKVVGAVAPAQRMPFAGQAVPHIDAIAAHEVIGGEHRPVLRVGDDGAVLGVRRAEAAVQLRRASLAGSSEAGGAQRWKAEALGAARGSLDMV
jgi:hypothetical protein